MKIAICFSGQPRFIKECCDGIKNNIINVNGSEIDVFVHTWFNDDMCNKVLYKNEISSFSGEATISNTAVDDIHRLYNPKRMIVEDPKKFITDQYIYESYIKFAMTNKSDFGVHVDDFRKIKVDASYSMMYSMMQSINLKKDYELSNGFKYDIVIKLRFDNIVNSPIKINDMDMEYLYSQEMNKPYYEISDWILISNSKNIDSISTIFLSFERLVDYSNEKFNGWSSESLIKSVCDRDQIKHKTLYLSTKLPAWGKLN